ncbi:MAG: PxKF domain-containing protein [Nitrosopumilaceae archaeon]
MGPRLDILCTVIVFTILVFGSLFEQNTFPAIEAQVPATLTIIATTNLSDDLFQFTVSGLTSYNPSIITESEEGFPGGGSHGPTIVEPGEYSIQETVPIGWALADIFCSNDNGTFDAVDTISGIQINSGDNIECTFANALLSTDYDDDGIDNPLDNLREEFSDDFNDFIFGGTSFGTITTRGDHILFITEVQNPLGVMITADRLGIEQAITSLCGNITSIAFDLLDQVIVTCGSVIVKTITGEVEVVLIASDGTQASTSIPNGNEITFDPQTSTINANPENTDIIVIMIENTFIPISPGSSNFVDVEPPQITINSLINDGDSFNFGNIPPEPTCIAQDDLSGVDGDCSVIGYQTIVGIHQIQFIASDLAGNTNTITIDYQILPWSIAGFYLPVDMGEVLNSVKGGSTVPLKFEVFQGTTELTETSIAQLIQQNVQCDTSMVIDEVEITTTGNTELRYDQDSSQFIFNWKTPKLPGTCWDITLETTDESSIVAHFTLK